MIYGVGLLAVIMLAICPRYILINEMDNKIEKLNADLGKQKLLFPVFQDFLKKMQLKVPDGLPFPEKAKLSREDIGRISFVFQEVAQKCNLSLEGIKPDVETLIDGSGHLLLNVTTKGNFVDFQIFLARLCKIPALENIEQIRIVKGSGDLELKLKLWFSKEQE